MIDWRLLFFTSALISIPLSHAIGVTDGLLAPVVGEKEPHSYLVVVLTHAYTPKRQPISVCSGILIGSKYVLTAAHCIEHSRPQDVHVQLYKSNTDVFKFYKGRVFHTTASRDQLINGTSMVHENQFDTIGVSRYHGLVNMAADAVVLELKRTPTLIAHQLLIPGAFKYYNAWSIPNTTNINTLFSPWEEVEKTDIVFPVTMIGAGGTITDSTDKVPGLNATVGLFKHTDTGALWLPQNVASWNLWNFIRLEPGYINSEMFFVRSKYSIDSGDSGGPVFISATDNSKYLIGVIAARYIHNGITINLIQGFNSNDITRLQQYSFPD